MVEENHASKYERLTPPELGEGSDQVKGDEKQTKSSEKRCWELDLTQLPNRIFLAPRGNFEAPYLKNDMSDFNKNFRRSTSYMYRKNPVVFIRDEKCLIRDKNLSQIPAEQLHLSKPPFQIEK